ncbi:MAG TPA: replication factor C large subunit, partial [Candidatus Micrarchaeota archaeon]|nr:replication factor C large subunit [Candidatus Micrarchaeota archaeon]
MEDLSEKYRPAKFDEFLGNRDAVDMVRKWALEWARGNRQKPLIITGPCGSGKTTLAMLGA